jgi:hypothetical protein
MAATGAALNKEPDPGSSERCLEEAPDCLGRHTNVKASQDPENDVYKLLSAAKAGCLKCVRYWLEVKKLNSRVTSDSGYTILQFAQWSYENTIGVQIHLGRLASGPPASGAHTGRDPFG